MFLSWRKSHTKGLLTLLDPGLEDITDVDTDPKRKFVSFRVTPSNDRILCVYAPSGHNISEQLVTRHSLKDCKIVWKTRVMGIKTKNIWRL